MPDANTAWTIVATMLVAVVGGGFAWWRGWLESPRRREERAIAAEAAKRSAAMADAILGESEVRDLGGGVISPARPGLVDRTATLEVAVATLVNQQGQLDALTGRVEVVEGTVSGLIAEKFESGAHAALRASEGARRGTLDGEIIDDEPRT